MPRTPNARPGDDIVVRVRDLTSAQKGHIDDICHSDWQHGDILKEGASFIEATVATLDAIIEDLEFKKGNDWHMYVAGSANKDLSDHMITMAVDNILKGLDNTITKINKAISKEASDTARLKDAMERSGKGIAAAIKDAITEPTPLPELDTFVKPERLPAQPTPAKHRERMIKYDILKTFDLAYFATEDHASEFAAFVVKAGDKYRLKGLEHMPCGRESHLDIPSQGVFVVSCKGR